MSGSNLVGTSPQFRRLLEALEMVAPADCTVLLQGETGTGKEVRARRHWAERAVSPMTWPGRKMGASRSRQIKRRFGSTTLPAWYQTRRLYEREEYSTHS